MGFCLDRIIFIQTTICSTGTEEATNSYKVLEINNVPPS